MLLTCTKCRQDKPLEGFSLRTEGRKKRRSACKDCEKQRCREWNRNHLQHRTNYTRKWRSENRQRHNWNHRAYNHGFRLSFEQFAALYELQNGSCASCGTPKPMVGHDGLMIDHHHGTNQQRGLLCSKCNLVIGQARESIEVLESCIKYLKQWQDAQRLLGELNGR